MYRKKKFAVPLNKTGYILRFTKHWSFHFIQFLSKN